MDRTPELDPEQQQSARLGNRFGQYIKQPGVATTLLVLFLLVAAINGIALWGILSSGREARDAVLGDLEVQTLATARSIEAYLASIRGDFLFLSRSPQLGEIDRLLTDSDPVVRRWSRIDLEATLLLFLSAHPEVESIAIIQDDTPLVAADRREGAPVLIPPNEWESEARREDHLFQGRWPIEASGAEIHAVLNSRTVLAQVAGTQAEEMMLLSETEFSDEKIDLRLPVSEPLNSAVRVEVLLQDWNPPIRWLLVREETRLGLLDSIGRLSSRYRITLLLNASLMTLALILGFIAFRQVRKGALLEAQARQQTEIRNLERQLLHNERLAGIGRLAAGLAHEINNPLEGMSNYLALLREDLERGDTSGSKDLVDRIQDGMTRVAAVTRQVLTFSDPGKAPPTVVDLRHVVSETLVFLKSSPLFSNIDLQFHFEEGDYRVKGNPVTLGQVFLNLLLNAAQVQPDGGEVLVEGSTAARQVTIRVIDQGPGISEEAMPHLFEPFYSGRSSTGLGLSLCLGIIRQHGGSINAENRSEGGASFVVTLPSFGSDEGAFRKGRSG